MLVTLSLGIEFKRLYQQSCNDPEQVTHAQLSRNSLAVV